MITHLYIFKGLNTLIPPHHVYNSCSKGFVLPSNKNFDYASAVKFRLSVNKNKSINVSENVRL